MSANPHRLGEFVSRADKAEELKQTLRERRMKLGCGCDDGPFRRRMEILEAILMDYLHGDQRSD